MRQRILLLSIVLPMLTNITSCKKKCTVVCTDTDLGVAVSGYSDADLDTIEVRQYEAPGFTKLKRYSIRYDAMNGLGFLSRNDNWEIYIPATNQTYRISDIKNQERATLSGDCNLTTGCLNGVTSFTLNGAVITAGHATISK